MTPSDLPSGPDAPMSDDHAATVRLNAQETPRQKRPRFPDTPWGRLRAAKGWSLRELSSRTGVNIALLSWIERGRATVMPDEARALLRALDG